MSTDRELMELAAKAAGLTGEWSKTIGGWDCLIIEDRGTSFTPWQPLHDDGDALRLAVELRLGVLHDPRSVAAYGQTGEHYLAAEKSGADSCAATRRAIVRAAAAIGESIP